MRRNKKIVYIIGIIILAICFIKIIYNLQPTCVFEIKDTRTHYEPRFIGSEIIYIYRYCMTINPPKDDAEIIDLMLEYCRKNKRSLENTGDYQTKMTVNAYDIRFYRENLKFRRIWKPENPEDTREELTEYAEFLLGSVEYYSKGDDNLYIKIRKNNDISNDTEYTLKKSEVFKEGQNHNMCGNKKFSGRSLCVSCGRNGRKIL